MGKSGDSSARVEADRAVTRLLAELRMTIEDTAALNVCPATPKREWSLARSWLRRRLSGTHGH